MSDPERLASARGLVLDVLRGEVDYGSHPWVFDEDVFWLAVWRVAQDAPAWLLGQLEDARWPLERRESAAGCLGCSLEEAGRALAIRVEHLRMTSTRTC